MSRAVGYIALAALVGIITVVVVTSVVLRIDYQAQTRAANEACRTMGGVPHEGMCFHPGVARDLMQLPRV